MTYEEKKAELANEVAQILANPDVKYWPDNIEKLAEHVLTKMAEAYRSAAMKNAPDGMAYNYHVGGIAADLKAEGLIP